MLTVSSQTGSSPKKKENKKLQSLYFFCFSVIQEMFYVHRVHLSKFKSHVIRAYLGISEISPFSADFLSEDSPCFLKFLLPVSGLSLVYNIKFI